MKLRRTLLSLAPLLVLALIVPACGSTSSSPSNGTLVIEEVTIGTGATAVSGDSVTVAYIGTFTNGSQFDAGTLPPFRLGTGAVIAGFDQGITGMRVGGRRRLTIPPNLGYGSQGSGPVPGNTTIRFDVTLLAIAGK